MKVPFTSAPDRHIAVYDGLVTTALCAAGADQRRAGGWSFPRAHERSRMAAISAVHDDRLGAPGSAVAFVKLIAFVATLVVVLVGVPLTAAVAIYTLAS